MNEPTRCPNCKKEFSDAKDPDYGTICPECGALFCPMPTQSPLISPINRGDLAKFWLAQNSDQRST